MDKSTLTFILIVFCLSATVWADRARLMYKNEADVRLEFDNVYETMQTKEFGVFESTPSVVDIEPFNPVFRSSGTDMYFMVRRGTEIFHVRLST